MHRPVRKHLPHTVPEWLPDQNTFFITINCYPRGHNHLCHPPTGDKILAAARHNHDHHIWNCRFLLLMPDHLHAIIDLPREPGLKTIVTNWKKYVARTAEISWQQNFFDHRLRDHHQLIEKLDYIALNPIRKGLCNRIEDWPWTFSGAQERRAIRSF